MPPHHKSSCKPCCEKKSKSHCAKSDVKRHDFRDCFAPREQQLLDDPSNTRVFNIDLRRAAKALFRVKYNNPDAVLNLFVYNENAYFTGQLAVGQPALAQQLATTFFQDVSGNSPLEVKISTGHFLPGRYTVRVVVVSSPTPVAFKLSVYEKRVCECVTVTPQDHQLCGFWQAETKGFLYHFHIIKRCDGKLYIDQYFGHRTSGFQKINIQYYDYNLLVPPYPVLEEYTPGVYRFQPDPMYDIWSYLNIDQTNQDGLLYSQGGNANPVMKVSVYYTRLENWRNYVIDFNNPGDYQSPPKQLNIFTNQILNNFNVQVNKFTESSDYPGLGEFLNLRDQLLTTGITTEHQGTDIWPEPVDFNYFSIPVNNPITTYVPVTLKDVDLLISPDFGGYVAYYNPDNQYELGMTIKLSGVKTASQIGIANEWLNTYFLFVGFDGEWCYLTPIRIGNNYPITALINLQSA